MAKTKLVWMEIEIDEAAFIQEPDKSNQAVAEDLTKKDCRQMEIFFKTLKQNLKIKTFVGTSANAVKIQIWTALIAMLILRFLQLRSQFHWSLSNLVALLRMNLFTHRDLWAWLNKPFDVLPIPYEPEQLRLHFA